MKRNDCFSSLFPIVLFCALTSAGSAALAQKEKLESVECSKFGIESPPEKVKCSYLTVPENRSKPGGRKLKLAVAFVKNEHGKKAAIPTVFLEGGPGGDSVQFADYWTNGRLAKLGDVVLFDQRGTGFSEPDFCPELGNAVVDIMFQDLDEEQALEAYLRETTRCRDSLVERGIDLGAYNSASTVADLKDLREALGIEQWNMIGQCYGARLELTAARDDPHGIRSMILISPLPVQVDMYDELPNGFNKTLSSVMKLCANDPTCNEQYPDLEKALEEIVLKLRKKPEVIHLSQHGIAKDDTIYINEQDLLTIIARGFLEYGGSATILPLALRELRAGNTGFLKAMMPFFREEVSWADMGLHYTVQCYEEAPFNSLEDWKKAVEKHPLWQDATLIDLFALHVCKNWHTETTPAMEDEPVQSDIPTILMTGEYDWITPHSWGEEAAATLSNSRVYMIPGEGHIPGGGGVGEGGKCGDSIWYQFLENPNKEPDSSCLKSVPGMTFPTDVYIKPGFSNLVSALSLGPDALTIVLLILTALVTLWVLLSWPIGFLIRRIERRASLEPKLARAAVWLARMAASLILLFFAGLFVLTSQTAEVNQMLLLFGLLGPAAPLFLLPWIITLLTLGLVIVAIWLWRKQYGTLRWRIHYTLLLPGFLAFIAFCNLWGL